MTVHLFPSLDEVLAAVNQTRRHLGLPLLSLLPSGLPRDAQNCPLHRALGLTAPSLVGETELLLFQQDGQPDDALATVLARGWGTPRQRHRVQLPELLRQFVGGVSRGYEGYLTLLAETSVSCHVCLGPIDVARPDDEEWTRNRDCWPVHRSCLLAERRSGRTLP